VLHFNLGKSKEALFSIDSAIEKESGNNDYRIQRQKIEEQIAPETWDTEIQKRNMKQDPANATAWFNLGVISYHAMEYFDALRYLDQAVTLDPLVSQA
jgi:hypothetical protein